MHLAAPGMRLVSRVLQGTSRDIFSSLPERRLCTGSTEWALPASKQNVSSSCRASSLPSRPPGDRRSQEFGAGFHSPRDPPGEQRQGFEEGQRRPRSAATWAFPAFPGALSLFALIPEARSGSRHLLLSPEEAMAKSRGCLYLWVCLAAALASFLGGFMVGKCTDPFPGSLQPPRRKAVEPGAEELGCALGAGPAELLEFQPNRKLSGMHFGLLNKVCQKFKFIKCSLSSGYC